MRISLPALLICILLTAVPTDAEAQSVRVERGNVVYVSAGGAARRLTSAGLDSSAVLSPDGRTVAFVRRTPGATVAPGAGGVELTELWVVGMGGAGARRLVRGVHAKPGDPPRAMLAGLHSPAFSPDGRHIYFMSSAWATSDAVHAVEVATGRERYVAPGNSLEVVPRGRHAGRLIVSQHRYFLGGGSYDWFWLLTPDGEDVGPVGETEEQVEEFRRMYVRP